MKINNISKSFDGKIVLRDFSLELADNGLTVIRGESGCGKTTLLRIIAGLEKSDSGQIDYGKIKRISYAFQENRLIDSCTALDNVAIVNGLNEKSRQSAKIMLDRLGLGDEIDKIPSELSGGMKQRVALARAFEYKCELLLIDEPFNALDAENKQKVFDIIVEKSRAVPCIMVTHDLAFELPQGTKVIELN